MPETIQPLSAIPGVTDDAVARVFDPYVTEEFDAQSARWRKAVERAEEKLGRLTPPWEHWLDPDGHRTADRVRSQYEQQWSNIALDAELRGVRQGWFEWRDRRMRARSIGFKRVLQLMVTRAVEWVAPESIVEVGFGWGLHLLTLSLEFPAVRVSGVELTAAGVRTARGLAEDDATPRALAGFAIRDVHDPAACRRVDLRQGSADALPLPDNSADVVVTILALEQMERIREQALREVARVARRYVIMIEPFAEWNVAPRQRGYIRQLDYWSGSIDQLPAFGLVPIAAHADIPQKLTSSAGIVVAQVK